LPVKAFVLERINYKSYNYFILPYKKYIQDYDKDKQALLLAIARQESRFIPSSVSSSYALGMMQFMPFLARATAKIKKIKDFDLDDMFNPGTAYSFAYDHIRYLQRKLKHPLFVAYAYNGGIGFTKRMLKSGFFQKGKYEPFISMELVPYGESRRYAKKVLSNYIVYKEILGEKVTLKNLLKKLK
jgi:soluble lytic murein transglycosylase